MRRKLELIILIITLTASCIGCSSFGTGSGDKGSFADTGFLPATPGNYDSLDTAIYVGCDKEQKTIRFYNMEVGKFYTLNYDGATGYHDKYAQAIALDQLSAGTLVDISFMRGRKRLNSLQVNGQAFSFERVENLIVPADSRQIFLMGENYTMDPNVVILTDNGPGETMDLNAVDKLHVAGVGHTVYSISVQKSHGYLRLENEEHFVGGFIEIGENRVYQVSRDMLLPVPEGSYDVTVSNKGSTGTQRITVEKGKEISLDVSKWVSEPKYGGVLFICDPPDADIFIDGTLIEKGKEARLSYGIHKMEAKADGYNTVSRYIRVAQELAKLSVKLEKGGSTSQNSTAGNDAAPSATPTPTAALTPTPTTADTSGGDAQPTEGSGSAPGYTDGLVSGSGETSNEGSNDAVTAGEYRVYIDAPEGVEVYKDGAYIGLTPLYFKKTEGTCIVTLRKEGFQTRSYTITMDSENKDVNYSFSELVPIN